MTDIIKELEKRKSQGNYRSLLKENTLIDFCSNDYLGLSNSEQLKENYKKRISNQDISPGAGGSRLLSGNYPEIEDLEGKIAAFHLAEGGLLFSSGYLANLGLFSCIAKRGDTIFYDECSHASIKDGVRLSFAKSYPFRHNNPEDLERKLEIAEGDIYVAVEALYSMEGDYCPLKDIIKLADKYSFNLIVDEAHTNGIHGRGGRGKCTEDGLQDKIFARVMTFGKALGIQGAAVIGQNILRQFLINFSRPFIYTTAMSGYQTALIDEAYKILPSLESERRKLFENINYYRENTRDESNLEGPIRIVPHKGNLEAKNKAQKLKDSGFDVRAILSPTVPEGRERLRICLHAFNTKDDIDKLIKVLNEQ